MDFKMPNSQELLKNFSLRGKVAKWAAVAASVVGMSVGMVMPAHAAPREIHRARCEPSTFNVYQGPKGDRPTMCFADAGRIPVIIADVHRFFSGNNSGFVLTNRGRRDFGKNETIEFINDGGTVTILTIHIEGANYWLSPYTHKL